METLAAFGVLFLLFLLAGLIFGGFYFVDWCQEMHKAMKECVRRIKALEEKKWHRTSLK